MEENLRTGAFAHDLGEGLWSRGEVKTKPENGTGLRPVVIFVHGFKSFMDWGFYSYVTDVFAEKGFYTVRFNFSCNGVGETDFDELDKFAVNTYSREQEDLAVLLERLLKRELPFAEQADLNRIALLGHSRGGGNSLIFAGEHPEIGSVVTWNGIAYADLFDDAFKAEIAERGVAYVPNARTKQLMPIRSVFYEDLRRNEERFDMVRILSGLGIPVLSVQADQDSERLQKGFAALRAAAPHQHFATIRGTGHTFGTVHPFAGTTPQLEEAIGTSIRFLERHLD
ncbi:alpha/beta hydrolase [Paenibacillus sp. P25]|nr:alpha/beta hydrolase [Paenibacillus sp. P25]